MAKTSDSPTVSSPVEHPRRPATVVQEAGVLPIRSVVRFEDGAVRRFLLRNLRALREAAAEHERDFARDQDDDDRDAALECRAQAAVLSDLLVLLFDPEAPPVDCPGKGVAG